MVELHVPAYAHFLEDGEIRVLVFDGSVRGRMGTAPTHAVAMGGHGGRVTVAAARVQIL